MAHVFYLHGFASSPQSTKIGYFSERLREHGVEVRCPDFNQPEFATLTITRMLEQLGAELTYNYNTDGEGLIKCRCRPGCQTLL